MRKNLTISLLAVFCALPATGQNWSIGLRSGAFVFGDFVERHLQPIAGEPATEPVTLTLSAATRPGLSVDLERELSPRWAARLQGTFTSSPLSVKDSSNDGTHIPSGDLNVATFALPIVFRINPNGAFRVHLYAGPAHAVYDFEPPAQAAGIVFGGLTRNRWGALAGAAVAWHLGPRLALEGGVSDLVTSSPFVREDLPRGPGFDIPKPHNVHTTLGIRWRF